MVTADDLRDIWKAHNADVAVLKAEIERLSAATNDLHSDICAENDNLKAEVERLRGYLSAAGISLTTASILMGKLASAEDAALFKNAADQVLEALGGVANEQSPSREGSNG